MSNTSHNSWVTYKKSKESVEAWEKRAEMFLKLKEHSQKVGLYIPAKHLREMVEIIEKYESD